jgi:hypothetical protein
LRFPDTGPAAALSTGFNALQYAFWTVRVATSAEFYPTLIATFKAAMPLIRFLNAPLIVKERFRAA